MSDDDELIERQPDDTSCPHCGTAHEADCPEGHAAWQAAAKAAERRHMGGHAEGMIP